MFLLFVLLLIKTLMKKFQFNFLKFQHFKGFKKYFLYNQILMKIFKKEKVQKKVLILQVNNFYLDFLIS